MNLNKAMLLGNLTRDPESRVIPSGQQVVSFGIATNRMWTDQSGAKQQKTEFHNIVAWGKLAQICAQYLKKGQLVYVEGRIENRSWDAQDGTKKSRTEIVLENMQMGPRFGPREGGSQMPSASAQTAQSSHDPIPVIDIDKEDIKAEDLPF
jgi:single-strand DNA-binding protein